MAKGRSSPFKDVGDIGDDVLPKAPFAVPRVIDHDPSHNVMDAGESPLRATFASRTLGTSDQRALIRRVWGDGVFNDEPKVAAILRTQNVVSEETSRVLQSALNIGRSLNELKLVLSQEEFDRGLRESREVFPGWSQGNMSKLMSVARFVDQRRFPPDVVPQSYTVLYEFTTLDEDQFNRARELDLFRPDVKRSAVQEFKRVVANTDDQIANGQHPPNSPEIKRIDDRLQLLQSELRELRKRRVRLANEDRDWLARRARGNR